MVKTLNGDSALLYKEVQDKKEIQKFISKLNQVQKYRYVIVNPMYKIQIQYPDTIINISVSNEYVRTTKTTYVSLSYNFTKLIEHM